ncbi:trypsin-like serine peptidase [Streptomyces sp. NPDC002573]|uniref:trypsin-like serine peptidase n=1 Tax=Streptomyces sp. NPDC002573 TaxID=3364651 RepID=UPI003694AE1A
MSLPTGNAWTVQDAIRFWTSQRMASAIDPSGRAAPPRGWSALRKRPSGATGANGEFFDGMKSVGVLFTTDKDMKAHYCTASVVRSTGRNLLLTAGHCVGSRAAFVPMYDHTKPAADQPYGVWPVKEWFRDAQYASDKSRNSDLDFAFASLADNGGRNVEDVVGGNTLTRSPGFTNQVTVIGYPRADHNPQDRAFRCTGVRTTALPAYYQMQIDCAGMWGGVSGGPWFSSLDPSGDTGQIIGNVGGFMQGGPDVDPKDPLYDRITYSPLYGDRFFQLYDDAQNAVHNDHGTYQPPPLPYSMGKAGTWKHAVAMTAGYYTGGSRGGTRHMDLIVLWDDGEVTLYQGGDSNATAHPFASEYRLAPRKSIWAKAVSLTSVNAGSSTDGLVVRWVDGEMTQYATVDAQGFHGEKQLAPRKTPLWQDDARVLVGGRFTSAGHRDDLLVAFKDGHVSLFSDLAVSGLSKQTQIVAKNTTTWPYAGQLTTGSFTGNVTEDLLVRWVDGETTLYPGLTGRGLPGEIRIRPRNSEWKDAAVVAAGAFTADTTANDVIVRWSDGHVSLFTGVDAKGLHDEVPLVPVG